MAEEVLSVDSVWSLSFPHPALSQRLSGRSLILKAVQKSRNGRTCPVLKRQNMLTLQKHLRQASQPACAGCAKRYRIAIRRRRIHEIVPRYQDSRMDSDAHHNGYCRSMMLFSVMIGRTVMSPDHG